MAKVNPFMFQTEFYDWETGKYYVKNRFYDPGTGRFLNRDPIGELGFRVLHCQKQRNRLAGNLYVFVVNDPNDKIDPIGLTDIWDVIACYDISGTLLDQGASGYQSGGFVGTVKAWAAKAGSALLAVVGA